MSRGLQSFYQGERDAFHEDVTGFRIAGVHSSRTSAAEKKVAMTSSGCGRAEFPFVRFSQP